MWQVLDLEAGAWECVASSIEDLEALGAELAQSAKRADQEMSSLVRIQHFQSVFGCCLAQQTVRCLRNPMQSWCSRQRRQLRGECWSAKWVNARHSSVPTNPVPQIVRSNCGCHASGACSGSWALSTLQ